MTRCFRCDSGAVYLYLGSSLDCVTAVGVVDTRLARSDRLKISHAWVNMIDSRKLSQSRHRGPFDEEQRIFDDLADADHADVVFTVSAPSGLVLYGLVSNSRVLIRCDHAKRGPRMK